MLNITSDSNKHIKKVKQLYKKKFRYKYQEFLVEGMRIVEQVLKRHELLSAIYVSEDALDHGRIDEILCIARELDIDCFSIEPRLFKSLCATDSTQGIIAVLKMPKYELDKITDKEILKLVIVDKVQDPGNLGTIIRTADSAGFDGVLLIKGTVDVFNDKTLRSTMGSIVDMPIIEIDDTDEMIQELKAKKVQIVATDLNTDKHHFDVCYNSKKAIIVGNEGSGIDKSLLDISDIRVKIPMIGSAESLNVSVASGIIMYEMVKQEIIQKIL